MTADLKTNYDPETNTSDVEKKSKNRRIENFENEANNMQMDEEDTQRSNLLNRKYLSVTFVLKYPVLFFYFYCVQ